MAGTATAVRPVSPRRGVSSRENSFSREQLPSKCGDATPRTDCLVPSTESPGDPEEANAVSLLMSPVSPSSRTRFIAVASAVATDPVSAVFALPRVAAAPMAGISNDAPLFGNTEALLLSRLPVLLLLAKVVDPVPEISAASERLAAAGTTIGSGDGGVVDILARVREKSRGERCDDVVRLIVWYLIYAARNSARDTKVLMMSVYRDY